MRFVDFKTLLQSICDEVAVREDYISKVPSDIRTGIFDNEYVNSLNKTLDLLLRHMFKDYFDDVEWFLYEVYIHRNAPKMITVDDKNYLISDLNTFLNYAKNELKFNEDETC